MNFNLKMLACAATLALAAQAATAASFNFSGNTDAGGPLPVQAFSGQFSFDETLLSNSGEEFVNLSAWNLLAFGNNYSFAGSDAAPRAAFMNGELLGVEVSYSTGVTPAVAMISSPFGVADAYLVYRTAAGLEGSGSYTVSVVPEPSSWALSLAGILALGALARRRAARA
ncbi:PEP-CTERM sorting domain-containing protein [Roseateles sp.]|uniref:PEP-CTERM sorting domain-containing protein n=1 Tax=Roseateles sp. TaxID=1971397 RepID=UPI002869FFC2|nr:PEP-CTERM sorting domain-containing protein [Roseateles sp.]